MRFWALQRWKGFWERGYNLIASKFRAGEANRSGMFVGVLVFTVLVCV